MGLLVVLFASAARAGVGAEVSIGNDYRYRGVSLTYGRPAALVGLDVDSASGLYASALVAAAPNENDRIVPAAGRAVAGYARPVGRGLTLDGGVSVTAVREPDVNVTRAEPEVFAGARRGGLSLYASYSPSYYGGGAQTLYLDATQSVRLGPRVRLFAHAGLLSPLNGGPYSPGTRGDFGAGAATRIAGLGLRLEVTTTSASHFEPGGRTALLVTLSRGF